MRRQTARSATVRSERRRPESRRRYRGPQRRPWAWFRLTTLVRVGQAGRNMNSGTHPRNTAHGEIPRSAGSTAPLSRSSASPHFANARGPSPSICRSGTRSRGRCSAIRPGPNRGGRCSRAPPSRRPHSCANPEGPDAMAGSRVIQRGVPPLQGAEDDRSKALRQAKAPLPGPRPADRSFRAVSRRDPAGPRFNQRSAPWCLTVGRRGATTGGIPSGSDRVEPTVVPCRLQRPQPAQRSSLSPEIAEQGGSTTSRPFGISLDGGDLFRRLLPTGQHRSPVHRTSLRVELAGEPVGRTPGRWPERRVSHLFRTRSAAATALVER